MSNDGFAKFVTYAGCAVITLACMNMGTCVDDGVAMRAMSAQGFTDAKIVDRSNMFSWANGCDGTDSVAWQMTAKRDGKPVNVTVCSGVWLKGATVRTR